MTEDEVIQRAARIAAGVFANQGWTYGLSGERGVPNAEYLEEHVIRYLMKRADETGGPVETGRIQVTRSKHDYEIYLNLGFIDAPERAELSE